MKVLFISNHSVQRCGVAEFGKIWASALRAEGVDVVEWDGSYATIYERKSYLPGDLSSYDLLHLNWDPAAINHYLPEHFPSKGDKPLSLFLHDVPPNSICPLWDRADLRISYEDTVAGPTVRLAHAIPTYAGFLQNMVKGEGKISVGVSGVRSDPGMAMVKDLCSRRGWELNAPLWWSGGPWLTWQEEIARLSKSTFNVCWYQTTGRGKSMAAMFCLASKRPLILSGSSMFSCLIPYRDEFYMTDSHESPGGGWDISRLENLTDNWLLPELKEGDVRLPERVLEEMSWGVRAKEIKKLWEGMLK